MAWLLQGGGVQNKPLGDRPHFIDDLVHGALIFDGFEHEQSFLRRETDAHGFARHFPRPAPGIGRIGQHTRDCARRGGRMFSRFFYSRNYCNNLFCEHIDMVFN